MAHHPDSLSTIFTRSVIERLRSAPRTDHLAYRLRAITGEGLAEPADESQVAFLQAQKSAWSEYIEAARGCGLLDGPDGRDVIARMTDVDDDQFRSAMAECLAAWYLGRKLGLDLSARPMGQGGRMLDLLARLPGGDVCVEVKSPFREAAADGEVRNVDDSDILARCLVDASKKFRKDRMNLVMLVGRMTLGVHAREFFVDAFYTTRKMVFPRLAGGTIGRVRIAYDDPPNGLFLKTWSDEGGPRHTRVSAVHYVEENIRFADVEHDALMMHNPNALQPLPAAPWGDCPQFVLRNDVMEWTDGHPG